MHIAANRMKRKTNKQYRMHANPQMNERYKVNNKQTKSVTPNNLWLIFQRIEYESLLNILSKY